MWITASLNTIKTPTLVALGNFDGVHRGHRQVIEPILTDPKVHSASCLFPVDIDAVDDEADDEVNESPSVYATVVTFHPHPQEFFTGKRRLLLTPLAEKAHYLKKMGVQQLVLLPFNQALARLTPPEFVETILVQQLQAKRISVGQDFCFGRQRSGTVTELRAIASQYDIAVDTVSLHRCQGERVSSSAIRQALSNGELQHANQLLGRPYALVGQVVQGQQLGRTIGFPTANLKLPDEKFLPKQGVYAVRVYCTAIGATERPLLGVMNIGYRPTVDGTQQTVEVHLLNWTGDLYDKTLTVSLESFLRSEQKFASLDELKAQIQIDCVNAQTALTQAV